MPFQTEIAPVLVVARLEEFAYAEATAIAVVLLAISFATLFAINLARTLELAPPWLTRTHPPAYLRAHEDPPLVRRGR